MKEVTINKEIKRPDVVARNKSLKQRLAVSKAMTGFKHTKKSIEKMSRALIGNNRHLGCKHSPEAIEKIKEARKKQIGENHPKWKGEDVGYGALHDWVRNQRGRPIVCEKCGATSNKRLIEWINKDHLYQRSLDNFMSLCRGCHRKYDIEHNNYKTHFMRALGCHKEI